MGARVIRSIPCVCALVLTACAGGDVAREATDFEGQRITGEATADSRVGHDRSVVHDRVVGYSPPGPDGPGIPSYCALRMLRGAFRAYDEYVRVVVEDGYWAIEAKSNPVDGAASAGPAGTVTCKALGDLGVPSADYGKFDAVRVLGSRAGSKAPYAPVVVDSFVPGHFSPLTAVNGRVRALGGDQARFVVDLGPPALYSEQHSECGGTPDECTLQAEVWDGSGAGYAFHTYGEILPWIDGTTGTSDADLGHSVETSWCYIGGIGGTWNADARAEIVDVGGKYHLRVRATTTTARARAYATCVPLPQFS